MPEPRQRLTRALYNIDVPTIDKLSVRVLVDSASDIFFRPQEANGVKTEPGRSADSRRPLHSEWGLSLLLEPQRGEIEAALPPIKPPAESGARL